MNLPGSAVKAAKNNGMLVALIGEIILFQILMFVMGNGSFLDPTNISNIISQNAYVVIIASGMLLCILTGGNIDLSVGSVIGFIGALAGILICRTGMNSYLAIFICVTAGIIIGAWQAFWVACVNIPPFIVTLAGWLYWRGATLLLLNNLTISPFPDNYLRLFTGFLPFSKDEEFTSGEAVHVLLFTLTAGLVICAGFAAYRVISRKKRIMKGYNTESLTAITVHVSVISAVIMYSAWMLGSYKGIPVVLILITIIACAYSYFTNKTVPGRHFYALGGNRKAARLSGINTKKIMFFAYTNMGFLAAVAGLLIAGRFNSASPSAGTNYEFDAIGACYIGGASASGGSGTIGGAVIGALFMGVLNNGMSLVGLSANWQKTIKGLVVLTAVVFDVLSKNRIKQNSNSK